MLGLIHPNETLVITRPMQKITKAERTGIKRKVGCWLVFTGIRQPLLGVDHHHPDCHEDSGEAEAEGDEQ